ncbi:MULTISPECIES: FAD/NAD(P)-binding protein [Pseudonocardia]|uniref:FAD/NAD(P)-binding protein n=1 Tax=Pseudonocardia TaxID=1847 RepID=UPI001E502773|nr:MULTISPECIES: FAD/NAD(P)-binding protein [Pseudonocardia]
MPSGTEPSRSAARNPAVVIVGAGPRGVGVLERMVAGAPEVYADVLAGPGLDVHLVDPFPAGAGRIWRHTQSPLLAMNSMAADVTMWTDDSVVCAGPIAPGPSFWEWAQELREHGDPVAELGAEGAAELATVTASTFPTRRLQSHYLGAVLREVLDRAPAGMRVHLHRTTAKSLTEDGPDQIVRLASGTTLRADVVVLASGHLDAAPTPDERDLAARAGELGLRYLPPEQTTDSDLSVIEPGETVLARGLGLAFVDLVVLLFEGRGGRFVPDSDSDSDAADADAAATTGEPGRLRYIPSGREPVLIAGSPRGATYHSKTHYQLRGGIPPLPHFLTPEVTDGLVALGRPVDFREEVWPLMAKEIGWGWYHELFHGHPDRVGTGWDDFAARFAAAPHGSPEETELITWVVPDPLDRLDLTALDRPLEGLHAPDLESLQARVRERIAEDLRQHVDERHTPHLGAFVAMLSVFTETTRLAGSDALSARSRARDLPWWQSFFNSVASGPPGFRVRELLALSRSGHLAFLGAGMDLTLDRDGFHATSASLAGADRVTAQVLVDARLPDPSLSRTADPLLGGLLARGEAVEEILLDDDGTLLRNTGLLSVRPADGALYTADGGVHERRFAIGPHTTVKVAGAFTRPGTNAQSLRYNDAVARAVLGSLPGRTADTCSSA